MTMQNKHVHHAEALIIVKKSLILLPSMEHLGCNQVPVIVTCCIIPHYGTLFLLCVRLTNSISGTTLMKELVAKI